MSTESQQKVVPDFSNISKVAKVEVKLYAELGRAKLSLNDAIEYDVGSVISLNKINNEPIDIFVDDILIAKGAIVAIEDTYGIKIVEMIDNNSIEKE